jgi:two-component system sensor histidine kinase FlrB
MQRARLADVFAEFIGSAARLEDSYRTLQGEVSQLRAQLEERNAALQSSMAETERMRSALQRILDSLPCGVIVLGARAAAARQMLTASPGIGDLPIVKANPRHAPGAPIRLLNPEAKALLGISSNPAYCADIPGQAGESLRAAYERVAGDPIPGSATSASAGHPDEAEQEFSVETAAGKRCLAVRYRKLGREGEPDEAVLILRDVTSHKKLEEERESARNQIALAQMATILAHEIRNPLASMELFAGLVEEHDGEHSDWIFHIQAGIRTLTGIVNNVLSFNSLGTPHVTRVRLSTVLRDGIEFLRPMSRQAGVSVSLDDELGDLEIPADENAIQQLILNLASNAFRHTAPGGQFKVLATTRTQPSGMRAVVEFSDTGSGIHPDYIGRIFEPGFSASGHTPGLGLAVCKRIVEQHQGTISVTSRLREGTTFHLEFPAQ